MREVEKLMHIKKLNESIDVLKEGLGKSLLVADIWRVEDGMTIAEYGAKAGSSALGNKLSAYINETLQAIGTPPLGKYFLLDLQGGSKIMCLPMNEYSAAIMIDKDVQLGLFLHVIVPKFLDKFEEALVE